MQKASILFCSIDCFYCGIPLSHFIVFELCSYGPQVASLFHTRTGFWVEFPYGRNWQTSYSTFSCWTPDISAKLHYIIVTFSYFFLLLFIRSKQLIIQILQQFKLLMLFLQTLFKFHKLVNIYLFFFFQLVICFF